MKAVRFLQALLLSLFITSAVHTESIVMKQTARGISALSDRDITTHGEVISDILQTYCWPMCQTTELSPEEQDQLLGPDGSEQLFLEQKLNTAIPAETRDFEFVVLFIPTTLYELFCIVEITRYDTGKSKAFFPIVSMFLYKHNPLHTYELLIQSGTNKSIMRDFCLLAHDCYKAQQGVEDKFPILESHQLFIKQLQKFHPLLEGLHTKESFNKIIITQAKNFGLYCIEKFVACAPLTKQLKFKMHAQIISSDLGTRLTCKFIAKEYELHQQNKGCLIRGSKPFFLNIHGKIRRVCTSPFTMKKTMQPHSISLGASLLAGFLEEGLFVNPLTYLMKEQSTLGFMVFYNKKEIYNQQKERLFYLPPVPTLAYLSLIKPLSHPRITAATQVEKGAKCKVYGIVNGYEIKDIDEVLLLRKDPVEHGCAFFKYFLDNHEIIYNPFASQETIEQTEQALLSAHCNTLTDLYAMKKPQERIKTIARHLTTAQAEPQLRARL